MKRHFDGKSTQSELAAGTKPSQKGISSLVNRFCVDFEPDREFNQACVDFRETETSLLLRRWHGGDQRALDALLVRHLPSIREQVQRRLGPELGRKETISDIAQDTVLEVLEYGPAFRVSDARHFRFLMARIVENVLRDKNDWYRARRRDRSRECPLPVETVVDLDRSAARGSSPEGEADQHEEEAYLRLGLDLLAPERREVLVLRVWESLTFADIGRRLAISEDAARKRCRRAMVHLERILRALRHGSWVEMLHAEETGA
jgi:RNA polymerase sigma-70 factor (ECF subfamily)